MLNERWYMSRDYQINGTCGCNSGICGKLVEKVADWEATDQVAVESNPDPVAALQAFIKDYVENKRWLPPTEAAPS